MPEQSRTHSPQSHDGVSISGTSGSAIDAQTALLDAMPIDAKTAAQFGAIAVERDVRRPHWLDPANIKPARDFQYLAKRTTDVFGGLTLLLLLSPLMLLIALAIKLNSRGPAVYKSVRMGLGGQHFTCYKFRTMVENADQMQLQLEHRNDAHGPIFKLEDDPRVTGVGRKLRAMALDELPQLVNVLIGQMSLVGPRPLPLRDCMELRLPDHRRHTVYPGMTGLWQVAPRRHEPGSSSIIELDLHYIDNWSYALDWRILFQTAVVVLRGSADPRHASDEA